MNIKRMLNKDKLPIPAEVKKWAWEINNPYVPCEIKAINYELRDSVVSDELVRWMTEGTDQRQPPRSDCG